MKNNERAFVWSANDYSGEVPTIEKLAVRFQYINGAEFFKAAFEAAKKFNQLVKEEKLTELVYAPVLEEVEEKVEEIDDPDKNKTADADGDDGDKGDEDKE